jgi:hypothetical protein
MIIVSAAEHIGLTGRCSVHEGGKNGDLEAMTRLNGILKPCGLMSLRVPVRQDAVFAPLCRVYSEKRLIQLLDGLAAEHEEYWVKDADNRWVSRHRETAPVFQAFVRK